MPSDALRLLSEALRDERPVVLFAGQSLGFSTPDDDLVLKQLLKRLDRCADPVGWTAALDQCGLNDRDLEWLSERFDRNVPSEAALRVFELSWSAAFTSSIDPRFNRRFATRGRQPEAVLARGTYARVSRSRSRPPIYYLLGRSNETQSDTRAPKTKADLKRRISSHATELLNRIAETATIRGVVVVAGYDPTTDWLPIDALLAPLSEQVGLTILWFGTFDMHWSDLAEELISKGSLIIVPTTLASALTELELAGQIITQGSAAPDEPGMVSLAKGVLDVTPALRLRVEASASIIDDEWTDTPDPLAGTAEEEAFRRFHGDLGGFRAMVDGVARDFAIKRDFETELWKSVEATLQRLAQSDGVIIIHGQSGTGKSVALARLVLALRRVLKLPVAVAISRLPTYADIDAFCSEAERAGASATVLVCDASQPPHRYYGLASALQSRGRRLLVVGTCYRIDGPKTRHSIEAPADISLNERTALASLVSRFGHQKSNTQALADDKSILAMLYRSLSPAREHITAGITGEARTVESVVRERARNFPRTARRSALADQLIELGLAEPSTPLFEDDEQLAGLGQDAAGRLIDYVMVAGRLDCPVPLNLIMRLLNQSTTGIEINQLAYLFAELDLFRWVATDAEGTAFLIKPRLQLEAELICRRRLADTKLESERLIELILGVRATGVDRIVERTFLLDLLQKLDREGPRGTEYRHGYLAFADALAELRLHRGLRDAALMLRECVFRRQAVWSLDGRDQVDEISDEQRLSILNSARETVDEAFRLIDAGELLASKRTRLNLASERASIYGYLAVQRGRTLDIEGMWSDYLAAKAASARAVAISDDYHPVDISLWTSSDVLKGADLSPERKAEVLADLYGALDLVDFGMLDQNQQIRFLDRKSRVAAVIGDHVLSNKALEELEDLAPAAATFLIARDRAQAVFTAEPPLDEKVRAVARTTADFISGRSEASVRDDPRCQRLLIRLRWAQSTGEQLLRNQRGRTPASEVVIAELLDITQRLNERLGMATLNREKFLEAVLLWLAKDSSRAIEIWRSLARDTEYEDRSRVIRRLLMTDQSGEAVRFRGRVESTGAANDWKVRVEGLNVPIPLLAREFQDEDLAHGRELSDFGIAFNYVGPIADPLTRIGRRR
jgi:hypothetical protein